MYAVVLLGGFFSAITLPLLRIHVPQNLPCLISFSSPALSHSVTGSDVTSLWKTHLTLQPRCIPVPSAASAFTPVLFQPFSPLTMSHTIDFWNLQVQCPMCTIAVLPPAPHSLIPTTPLSTLPRSPGLLRFHFLPPSPSQTPDNSFLSSFPICQLGSPDPSLDPASCQCSQHPYPFGHSAAPARQTTTHVCPGVDLLCSKSRLMSSARGSHPSWRWVPLGVPGLQPLLGPQPVQRAFHGPSNLSVPSSSWRSLSSIVHTLL